MHPRKFLFLLSLNGDLHGLEGTQFTARRSSLAMDGDTGWNLFIYLFIIYFMIVFLLLIFIILFYLFLFLFLKLVLKDP